MFSYLGPLLLTFFIALFILLMQFVWKYVDDLVGKGLDIFVIGELLFFASASFVPMALPLAILLSSIMAFGNFGEQSELTACKAAGISLQKVMQPLIVLSLMLSVVAFYFSNNILPIANLKFGALLYDVRQQRPAFALKEGIFYTGLEGFSIKVEKIGKDGKSMKKIMIYDHTDNLGNIKLVTADSGVMGNDHKNILSFKLFSGHMLEEVQNDQKPGSLVLQRTAFRESEKKFDMSSYKFTRTDEELFKDNYQMLNLNQLAMVTDSTFIEWEAERKKFLVNLSRFTDPVLDSATHSMQVPKPEEGKIFDILSLPGSDKSQRIKVVENSLALARNARQFSMTLVEDHGYIFSSLVKYDIEWHRKFTLSIACFILFFIGAPLGAIIRKGGLGLPVFMATVFFVFFHMISISGEKFAKEEMISVEGGMWLASLVMFPIGVFLTIKATTDSALFDINAYFGFIRSVFTRKEKG